MSGVGWYVHHHGSGHLRRMRAVAAHLRAPVTVLSSLPPPDGADHAWLRLPLDVDDAGPAEPVDATAHGELHWAPIGQPGLRARMAAVSAWIEATAPAAIVVDASVEVALLARLHGVPVVVVAAPGHRDDPAHRLGFAVAELLVAPWPAWAAPLTPAPRDLHAVGALSLLPALRGDAEAAPVPGSVLLIAGAGGSDHGPGEVLAAAAACPGTRWTVLGMRGTDGPGVRFRGHVSDVGGELCAAEVVVAHAGQNAVADVAAARRPAIILAQRRPFGEQLATTRVLAEAGLAATAQGWPSPGAWPALLEEARAVGGTGWELWNDGGGARRAAALIDGVAG